MGDRRRREEMGARSQKKEIWTNLHESAFDAVDGFVDGHHIHGAINYTFEIVVRALSQSQLPYDRSNIMEQEVEVN